jgi:hypothetical protein
MKRGVVTVVCLTAWIGVRGAADQSSPAAPAAFAAELETRADAIRPTAAETRWQQIPWLRSVIEGQQAALAEKRPIMYWHVDDDPLERC